jgi:hypothetical protein
MGYLKISELFKSLSDAEPYSEEYYKLIRVIDCELFKINFDISIKEAKLHKIKQENEKQYKLF